MTTATTYSWKLLRAGNFRLDGGSMFGLIPRSVWSRAAVPDERGRVGVQHNCLLLERATGSDGPKLVLIEVGTGDKLDAKSREIFSLEDRTILDALHEANCKAEDVGAIVTTHLHFDHSGALTRLAKPGEKPDWHGAASSMAGGSREHGVKVTFPNAPIYTQLREWDDALANKSVMTRTYFKDHLEPIRERVKLVDSPRPFPTGYAAGREERPLTPIYNRPTPLPGVPGVSVFLTPGHTWGQQAILFKDTRGRTVVFTPDVLPTVNHVGAAYSLGYDVEPYTSMISRHWFLEEAVLNDWLLVLDHEAGNPCQRVRRGPTGWYTLEAEG